MKCLTIQHPWIGQILDGTKTVEWRSWATSYRGPLLLHAGKGVDEAAMALDVNTPYRTLPRGVLIAVAELTTVRRAEPLFEDAEATFAWELGPVHRIAAPVPWRGQQGLFDVPDAVIATLLP